jgi:hypothetical protein
MPDASPLDGSAPITPGQPPIAAAEGPAHRSGYPVQRVGRGFIAFYTAAYLSTVLVLLAPLLVTLALKINSLVGIEQPRTAWRWSPGSAPWWRCSATRSSAG